MADTQDDPFRLDPAATDAWRAGSSSITDLAPAAEDKSVSGLVSSLTSLQRDKVATDTRISNQFDRDAAHDQVYRDRAFAAEGVAASEMPRPWDADKEHKRFEANPIEGFASTGGLFAMIASAFTKAPMENAINGMAGAINSIREGNEKGYERAYEAFKTNVKLAEQRFKTQHELYQDALSLGTADMAASQAKLHNAAVRFGDSQTLMLAEHGMIKEIYELQEARAKANQQMIESADAIDLHKIQKAAVDALKKGFQPTDDPVQDKVTLAANIYRIYNGQGKVQSAEQEAVGKYVNGHINQEPNAFAEGLAQIHQQFSAKAENKLAFENAKQQYRDTHDGAEPPPEEEARMLQAAGLKSEPRGTGAGQSQSSQARKTRAIEEIQKKHADEGKPISIAEAEKEYNNTVQIPSAHDRFGTEAQYQKAQLMEHTMDQIDDLLLKHKFITGIGGTLTRPVEALGNVLGSNATDRKQFERWVTELQTWGQSVLNDRSGRPLSAEVQKAATEFAGLKPGDTGANTIRSIVEMRPLIKQIKQNLKDRYDQKGPLSGGGESPPAAKEEPAGKDAPWLRDPVKP